MSSKSKRPSGVSNRGVKSKRPRSGEGSWKRENQYTNPNPDIAVKKKPLHLGSTEERKSESLLRARTREIAEQAARDGVTPLEVMLTNMRWAHNESIKVLERLESFMSNEIEAAEALGEESDEGEEVGEAGKQRGRGRINVARAIMREFTSMRKLAQQFAVDAAPYVHPKLASVEWKPSGGDTEIAMIKRVIVDGTARALNRDT